MSDQGNANWSGKEAPQGTGNGDPNRGAMDSGEERSQGSRPRRGCGLDGETWWKDRSLPQKILLGIGFGAAGAALLALCGWVVMLLWNWLMPEIFGLKTLSYWQAWGLLILSSLLFKGMRFGSDSSGRRAERKRRQQLRHSLADERS